MRLLIIRHGKAEPAAPSGRDEDRVLKPRGERQARFLGEHLAQHGPRPVLILASRYPRARDTANIIRDLTGAPVQLTRELEVGNPPSLAVKLIAQHAASDPLALVGHNPQLAELVSVLTRGVPPQNSELRTGEAVLLELNPAGAVGSAREVRRLRLDDDE